MSAASLLEDLVRTPSVTGDEAAAVALLQRQARGDGLRVIEDAAGNFIAEAGSGPRLLLFVGHVDTVPGHIPVRVEDGVLWGRGSVDAKGPLVAAYEAAKAFRDDQRITLRVVGAVGEEGDSRGARALDSGQPEWILVGEPSGVAGITVAYKGIVRASFACELPARHGAHAGPSAAGQIVAFWSAIGQALACGDGYGDFQARLDSMQCHSDGLVERAWGDFQIRLPPGRPWQDTWSTLQDLAEGYVVALTRSEAVDAAEGNVRSPLVSVLRHAIRTQGQEPRILRKTGTADFNLLAARHPGVPIAAYGPGDASLDHTPEERVALGDVATSIAILQAAFEALANSPPASAPVLSPHSGPTPFAGSALAEP